MSRIKDKAKAVAARITRDRVRWVVRTHVQSWAIQGTVAVTLSLSGVGAVAALVAAKVTAYAVFAGQCVTAVRVK